LSIKRFAILVVKYGLLLTALFATAGLSAVATMRAVLASQEVIVPNLSGQRVAEASAMAAQAGLQLRVEGKRHDSRVPRDHVGTQEPAPGTVLKAYRSVRVWLSLGPRRLEVPDVESGSLRAARLALNQAQVPLGRVVEVDYPAPEGTVVMQRPPAGQTDAIGPGVSLLVSRGPGGKNHLMPDLIGRRGPAVLRSLELAGWKTSVRYRTYPGVAAGIVLRQRPASGHPIGPRASVALEISKQ
jgi:beta-lactam-binding protein with PASTA domain